MINEYKVRRPIPYRGLPEPVRGYEMLKKFEWLEDFLRLKALQEEISVLEKERHEIEEAPSAKQDVERRVLANLEELRQERIRWLAKMIGEGWNKVRPLKLMESRLRN